MTLVELLVVVTVIMLLAGLLVPLIGLARSLVKNSVCAGNLHQIGIAVNLYAGEHGGLAPGSKVWGVNDRARSIAWFHRLPAYLGQSEVGASGPFQCPLFVWHAPSSTKGLAGEPPKSFKMNADIDSEHGRYVPFAIAGVRDAASLVLFIDGNTGPGMGLWGHAPPAAVDDRRHRGAANVLFADGHAVRLVKVHDSSVWAVAVKWRSDEWDGK